MTFACVEYGRKQNYSYLRNVFLFNHTFQFVLLLISHNQAETLFKIIKLFGCSNAECFSLKWEDSELDLACVRLFPKIQNLQKNQKNKLCFVEYY